MFRLGRWINLILCTLDLHTLNNFFSYFSEFRENFKNVSLLSMSLLRMTVYLFLLNPTLHSNLHWKYQPWTGKLDSSSSCILPGNWSHMDYLEILLETWITLSKRDFTTRYQYVYMWTEKQQLAHQTINGCNASTWDLYGSGTIFGPSEGEYGSMLE